MVQFSRLWQEKKPTVSFEFFPARSEKSAEKLERVIGELAAEKPDFLSVTFGAGGSTRSGSLELAKKLLAFPGQNVVAYLAAYGLSPEDIAAVSEAYMQAGVHSILCVRGDKPEGEEEIAPHPHGFTYAAELVGFLSGRTSLPLGVAGYPEGHAEAESREKDWEFLKAKAGRGAAYIISQYFYDNRHFFEFRDAFRRDGGGIPILAGVMPIYSVKMTRNLAERCGASLPVEVGEFLARVDPEDKEAVENFGVELALRQCRELLGKGVDGLHFYTMDRGSSVKRIVRQLRGEGLLPLKE